MDPFTTILRAVIGKKVIDKAANSELVKNATNDAKAGLEMTGQNIANAAAGAINWAGDTTNKVKNKASQILDEASRKGSEAFNGALDSYFKLFGLGYKDGQVYSPEVEKVIQQLSEQAKKNKTDTATLQEVVQAVENNGNVLNKEETATNTEPSTGEDESDVVTYTYKPGDTFGQVLLNLGLSDGTKLWGTGGDVEYYTQQLRDQNMLDSRGNVKLGIPFKLRRRK